MKMFYEKDTNVNLISFENMGLDPKLKHQIKTSNW